ncbi:MAG: transcription antitermination factor NusB [Micropepsaceae bacterium]
MGLNRAAHPEDEAAGLPARRFAFSLVTRVLDQRVTLEEAGEALAAVAARMEARDAAFGRAIAYASLRHKGALEALLKRFIERPLPEHGLAASRVLLTGAAELMILGGKPHAAVDGANRLALAVREAKPFKALINAVLRRVTREGHAIWDGLDRARANVPDWLWTRWTDAYGEASARAIALAHETPAPLDITLKDPAASPVWAARLDAESLGNGTLRLAKSGPVEALAGFDTGDWWVQDFAAAIPARVLLGFFPDPSRARIADLCAAPGGKTMQLAASGAAVTAVDTSAPRLKRLTENLARTGLSAHVEKADIRTFTPESPFDGILLDAPCSATGTIRRHPELPWIRDEGAVTRPAAVTSALLDAAFAMLKPGGTLVFAVCSLEIEEGEDQIAAFLARTPTASLRPIDPATFGLPPESGIPPGLRLIPSMRAELGGLDGFFVAALQRAV